MRIFVTGSDGYLGSLLVPALLKLGHDVVGLDTGFFKERSLYRSGDPAPRTLVKDLREIEAGDLTGYDAIVHMAELSNDPAGQLAPNITYEINHQGSVRLGELAQKASVRRFVYMSSCSVYGVSGGEFMTEESPLDPQTAYAICKTLVERDVMAMANAQFAPTFLRNATAYGASPRMRFDIVLNNLAGHAWTTGEIKMTSDGTPWRPLVHALDIAKAIGCALDAPIDAVSGQVFNVGSNAQNYQVREIAEIVAAVVPGCTLSFGKPGADNRSYRVSFDKIHAKLPGFSCEWDARRGAAQLAEVFRSVDFDAAAFSHRGFTRLAQLEFLIRTGQLDANFFWVRREAASPVASRGARP